MLLLIDNFDSFTYNLVQYFYILNQAVKVVRNGTALESCRELNPAYLVISPGPGNPNQAGHSLEILHYFAEKIPVLGVCLGHQCLAQQYGAKVVRAFAPMHGKPSAIFHDGQGLFSELKQGFQAIRYHSLIVERSSLPPCLTISAETTLGEIMGLRHRQFPLLQSVQFHPESLLTEAGLQLLTNFIKKI